MNLHDSCLNGFMGYFELDWAEVTLRIEKGPSQVTCRFRTGLGGWTNNLGSQTWENGRSWALKIQEKENEEFFCVKINEVSEMIIITRENIISTKIVVTFSEFLRRFRIWFPFYHTMSLSRGIFAYRWPNFDLEAPLAPRAVPTLMS